MSLIRQYKPYKALQGIIRQYRAMEGNISPIREYKPYKALSGLIGQ